MGYLKEKYTKEYFLGAVDKETNKIYGVDGFESFKKGHIDKRYLRFLRFLDIEAKEILDIGCGRGEVVNYCARKGTRKVVGTDFSEDAVRIASELNKSNPNAEIIEMEAKDIIFENKFDIIFMLDVIEHITDEEMQGIYPRVYRALKKNGMLILNTPIFSSTNSHDESDRIPATKGIHCNKQTKEKLSDDLLKYNFRKYTINVWRKSEKVLLSQYLYAAILNIRLRLDSFLLKWLNRIRHPGRTLNNLIKRFRGRYNGT